MKKVFSIVSMVYFALVLGASPVLSQEPVKMGVITVLSGPFAILGDSEVNAAKMAVEEYGTVLGKKIELLVRDNVLQAGLSVEKAKELYEKEGVDALFAVPHGAGALGAADQALKNKKIFFATSTASTDLISRNRYTFKWTYHGYAPAVAIGLWGAENLGKTFYTLVTDYAPTRSAYEWYIASLKKMGGIHVGNDFVALGTPDFSPYILKAQKAKPDVLILLNIGRDTVNSLKAASEYGLRQKVKIIAAMPTELDIKAAGLDVFADVYCALPWNWQVENPGAREFADRYYKRFGSRPMFLSAGLYSAIWQYLDAIKRAGTKETIPVIKALENHSFRDFFANPGYIRAEDHLQISDYFMMRIRKSEEVKEKEGFFEILDRIPAEKIQPDPGFFDRKLGKF